MFERAWPGVPGPYRRFTYDVVRVWELPPDRLLAGLGTLPLAPIGGVREADLPGVLKDMKARLRRQNRSVVDQFRTSTYVLMGLRYEEGLIRGLIEEVLGMEESVTYQAIIRKGKSAGAVEEAQKIVLRQGELRFGAPAGRRGRPCCGSRTWRPWSS